MPRSTRAQQEADRVVRAIEARRERAPRANALEGRVYSILFGDVAHKMTREECEELEGIALALGRCGEPGSGDVDAETAQFYHAKFDALEARRSMVAPSAVLGEHGEARS